MELGYRSELASSTRLSPVATVFSYAASLTFVLLLGTPNVMSQDDVDDIDDVDPVNPVTVEDGFFKRGDVNCNGYVSLLDVTDLMASLFLNIPVACDCLDARDADDDGGVNLQDAIYILSFLTLSNSSRPALPGPWNCGPDPTKDSLDCVGYPKILCGTPRYKRGDVNCDGCVDSSDARALRNSLFTGEPLECDCHDAQDADGNGRIELSDVVFLLQFCEEGGAAPPAPGPYLCGNPDPANTNCNEYPRDACLTDCANQVPGDCNQDGAVDISDGVCLLGYLFAGNPEELPCGNGTRSDAGNLRLLDWDGRRENLGMADAIGLFRWLFMGGPGHPLGQECTWIEACPTNEKCQTDNKPPRPTDNQILGLRRR